jgi:carboxyl-terminal processing protease
VKEPELTEEQTAALAKLIESRKIPRFVQENPEAAEKALSAFVGQLAAEFPGLSERILRRMIRGEVTRHMSTPPVYDMDYDTVLKEAVKYFWEAK